MMHGRKIIKLILNVFYSSWLHLTIRAIFCWSWCFKECDFE